MWGAEWLVAHVLLRELVSLLACLRLISIVQLWIFSPSAAWTQPQARCNGVLRLRGHSDRHDTQAAGKQGDYGLSIHRPSRQAAASSGSDPSCLEGTAFVCDF